MPNVAEKEAVVAELRAKIDASPLIVLTDFKGATVKEINRIRRGVEKGGTRFQVVKNSLCVRALEGTGKEKLGDYFKGNIGVLFSSPDPIASARLFKEQLKGADKFVVRAAMFEGEVLDEKGLHGVADLPGREELLSRLLGTLQAAPRQVLGIIQAPARDLVYVLNNYAAKLEKDEQAT